VGQGKEPMAEKTAEVKARAAEAKARAVVRMQ